MAKQGEIEVYVKSRSSKCLTGQWVSWRSLPSMARKCGAMSTACAMSAACAVIAAIRVEFRKEAWRHQAPPLPKRWLPMVVTNHVKRETGSYETFLIWGEGWCEEASNAASIHPGVCTRMTEIENNKSTSGSRCCALSCSLPPLGCLATSPHLPHWLTSPPSLLNPVLSDLGPRSQSTPLILRQVPLFTWPQAQCGRMIFQFIHVVKSPAYLLFHPCGKWGWAEG